MHDLTITPGNEDSPIIITVAEIQKILIDLEEEDAIGLEIALKDLYLSKYSGTVNMEFHVRFMKPFPAITHAAANDKDWWL